MLENSLAVSCKVKSAFAWDLEIALVVIYPREMKTYVHIKTYT